MIAIGLIISFIFGLSIIYAISPKFSILEKIGLSFIVGIGVQTILMVILDLFSIKITLTSIFISTFIVFLISAYFCYLKREEILSGFKNFSLKNLNIKKYTILWLVLLGFLIYFEFLNFEKCIYFPTFDRDSIAGFDFIGRVVANENCILSSSYYSDPEVSVMAGASYFNYTPLVQLSYAYIYLLGAESSKLISALFFLSFLISFYAALRNKISPVLAMFATLLTILVPEFIAFSSMSTTNIIHGIFASLAIIYAWLYFETNEKRYFVLCTILTGLNVWARLEGVVFIAAIALILLIKAIQTKKVKRLILFSVISISPLLFWLMYLKINSFGNYGDSIIFSLFWDPEKAKTLITMAKNLLFNTTYFSLTFYIFVVFAVASIYFMIRSKKNYSMVLMFVVALIVNVVLLYQLEYNWAKIEDVMQSSFKRLLFCFVPIAWAFSFTNPLMIKFNNWLEKMLN